MVTSGVSRWRALRAWLGSRCLRSRRACVSVVVPRAASGVGLAECEYRSGYGDDPLQLGHSVNIVRGTGTTGYS